MSISGVSPFSPLHASDPRAEFQRLRELHAKGPNGYDSQRRTEETESRPSAAATALADPSAIAENAKRASAPTRIDFSV